MRLSKRGEYGLRAMIMLAGTSETDTPLPMVQIKEISQREQISAKFLEQILLTLKNAGLLHSKMGVGGGYYLARPPGEITLRRDMTYDDWYGFFVPAGTPADRVAYLHRAITTVLKSPAVSQKIVEAGGELVAGTPEQLAAQLQQDVARWGRVAKLSGAALD